VSNNANPVGFESPNFGHAFLDGFEDLYNTNREREEYGDFGDDDSHPSPSSMRNTTTNTMNRGPRSVSNENQAYRNRGRTLLHASDGHAMVRPHGGMMGLRELPGSSNDKRKDSQLADTPPSYANAFLGDPEPSLDDLLVAPPPEWTLCCVCHEVSL